MTEDIKLFEAMKNGDDRAFDIFFTKYYKVLCLSASRYVNNNEAEEVVQGVMIWLWENKNTIEIEGSVINYLAICVKNKCLTIINRIEINRKVMTLWYEKMESLNNNVDLYIVQELSENIEKAVDNLPDLYKEAFISNRYHKMTYNEIAEKEGVSPKTIDYRIQQALKVLREKLKDYL